MYQEDGMAPSGQLTAPALQELLQGAKLAGSWTLDASRSQIGLRSKSMWGMSPVKGVFGRIAGQGTVTPDGQVTGTITVAAESIDTKVKKRDTHLRSAEFFDAGHHPSIVFTLDSTTPAGDGVTVTGTLTVRDRTRPVSFPATVSVSGDGSEVTFDGELHVNRSDFGLNWNQLGMASMHNTITIHAVFTKR
jgi:polyisoprenoid-binding protein YceI